MRIRDKVIYGITATLWVGILVLLFLPSLYWMVRPEQECLILEREIQISNSAISVAIDHDGKIFIYFDKFSERFITVYSNQGEFIHTIVVGNFTESGTIFIGENGNLYLYNFRSNTVNEFSDNGCIIKTYQEDEFLDLSEEQTKPPHFPLSFVDNEGNGFIVNSSLGKIEILKTVNGINVSVLETSAIYQVFNAVKAFGFVLLMAFHIASVLIYMKNQKRKSFETTQEK
ncbi:MAG: hypothetical protein CVV56_02110 [Tenericutes bacterium HGW-Tenericutes-1]|jgi:hypothetical protein|nr:MAG: hypothetical protein CVV56_02110 [Tenericutes bacterium HGW-Tenericutes-1]